MKNMDYSINWSTNTITVTKKFMNAASQMNTDAYSLMTELRALGMKMTVKEMPHRKACPTRLTYNRMLAHIKCMDDAESCLKEFNIIRADSLSTENPYQFVREWFMDRFPNHGKLPEMNTDYRIVNTPANYNTQTAKN